MSLTVAVFLTFNIEHRNDDEEAFHEIVPRN